MGKNPLKSQLIKHQIRKHELELQSSHGIHIHISRMAQRRGGKKEGKRRGAYWLSKYYFLHLYLSIPVLFLRWNELKISVYCILTLQNL